MKTKTTKSDVLTWMRDYKFFCLRKKAKGKKEKMEITTEGQKNSRRKEKKRRKKNNFIQKNNEESKKIMRLLCFGKKLVTRLTGDGDKERDIRAILMVHIVLFLPVFSIIFLTLMHPFIFGSWDKIIQKVGRAFIRRTRYNSCHDFASSHRNNY